MASVGFVIIAPQDKNAGPGQQCWMREFLIAETAPRQHLFS